MRQELDALFTKDTEHPAIDNMIGNSAFYRNQKPSYRLDIDMTSELIIRLFPPIHYLTKSDFC